MATHKAVYRSSKVSESKVSHLCSIFSAVALLFSQQPSEACGSVPILRRGKLRLREGQAAHWASLQEGKWKEAPDCSHLQACVCGEDWGLVVDRKDGDGEGHWMALAVDF